MLWSRRQDCKLNFTTNTFELRSMKRSLIGIITVVALILNGCSNNNQHKKEETMKTTNTEVPKISDFPVGEPNTAYAQYFQVVHGLHHSPV